MIGCTLDWFHQIGNYFSPRKNAAPWAAMELVTSLRSSLDTWCTSIRTATDYPTYLWKGITGRACTPYQCPPDPTSPSINMREWHSFIGIEGRWKVRWRAWNPNLMNVREWNSERWRKMTRKQKGMGWGEIREWCLGNATRENGSREGSNGCARTLKVVKGDIESRKKLAKGKLANEKDEESKVWHKCQKHKHNAKSGRRSAKRRCWMSVGRTVLWSSRGFALLGS